MFIRVDGSYAREELGLVLSWVWGALPDDIARVCSVELTFKPYNFDDRETYVPHIEGRPPGIVLIPGPGKPIEDVDVSMKWIYPGVPAWGAQA